jgi:hypothetical protein
MVSVNARKNKMMVTVFFFRFSQDNGFPPKRLPDDWKESVRMTSSRSCYEIIKDDYAIFFSKR